jgi:acyl-CoA synthetase (AMP-forming)/AMP-acid ligase II
MLLDQIIENAARRAPDEPAIVTASASLSFAELDARIDARTAWLTRHTRPGDRVAILGENRIEYLECLYAAARAGRIAAPVNHRLHPSEWRGLLMQCGAGLVIAEHPFATALEPQLDGTGIEIHPFEIPQSRTATTPTEPRPPGRESTASASRAPRAETDVAWLIATSGTTGLPKWAMLTHRSLTAGITNLALARRIADDDVLLTPFPMCHVAVYNVLAFHLHARPVVLLTRFDADVMNQLIGQHRVRTLSLAPTMIASWLDAPSTATANLRSLRTVGYGASAISAPVLVRAVRELGVDLSQGYGMTELSGNAVFLGPGEHRAAADGDERYLRAAGRAGPLVALKIVGDDGVEVAPGTPGEIWVRGDQVGAGYWNQPEATAASFGDDGWFRTGDLGRIDGDGLVSIVDRKKDVLVTGGENVSSREVEQVLEHHPGVREVAVIGVTDVHWGENVCAIVVPEDRSHPPTLDELVDFCRERLAGFKKPKHLVLIDELPKNATGKVQKAALRARYGSTSG